MNSTRLVALFVVGLVCLPPALQAAEGQTPALPSFPGAEGFGAVTPGGRGGSVIKVTNLETSGPGSLQAACDAQGARIVLFDVSGVIEGGVTISQSNITIAGQTSPGAGITIRGILKTQYPKRISDVIVRFLRVRPPASSKKWAGGDAIQIGVADRVILDHVSCSWASDETIDVYAATNVTVQWCTIEESDATGHSKGRHNYGLISGPKGGRVTLHHNLFAHHSRRCPAIANGPSDVRNNVIYNFLSGLSHEGHRPNKEGFNIVGNYWKRGPSSERIYPFGFTTGAYHVADNFIDGFGLIQDPRSRGVRVPRFFQINTRGKVLTTPVSAPKVATQNPEDAYELVLKKAGSFPRDVVTKRIVRDVREGTGAWGRIEPDDFMEGLTPKPPPRDSDGDGMPDEWERNHGLNLGAKDHNARMQSGYTAVEEYVNELAAALIGEKPPRKERKETGPGVWSLVVEKLSRQGATVADVLRESAAAVEDARRDASRDPDAAAGAVEALASGAEADESKIVLGRVARGLRATVELRRWVIEGAAAGRREKVFVDFLGRPMRALVQSADERGLTAVCLGNDVTVPWEELSPQRLFILARKYARSPPEKAAVLEDFCFAFGLGDG